MDIDILSEFLVLAEKLNYTETASALYLAQPVLSRHIRLLEEELGTALFRRNRQSVELTKMGELFLEDASMIVETWKQSKRKIERAMNVYESSLTICFLDAASRDYLPVWITQFFAENPSVSLELKSVGIPQTFQLMEKRDADLALTLRSTKEDESTYQMKHLYRDPLMLVVPKTHPLTKRKSVKLSELREERFIMSSPDLVSDYQMFVDELLKKAGITKVNKKIVDSVEQGFMLIESQYGIGIVPKHQKYFATDRVCFIPIEDENCYVDVVLAWKWDNKNPNIQKFIHVVETTARQKKQIES